MLDDGLASLYHWIATEAKRRRIEIHWITTWRMYRKRVVFPSGISAGLSLTMLSWFKQWERNVAFADGVQLRRSVGLWS
jgi:hypothetical protein